MAGGSSKTVVFIHGAWMTSACWDNFRGTFEAAGFTTHAPTWPFLGGAPAAELREHPPAGLGSLSVGAIVDHYQAFIARLPEQPLLIGHSFGGLYAQLLLDRGVGIAGIAIDPGPVAGVIPGPVSLAAAFPVLARWNGWNRPFTLSRSAFASSFANAAPADIQQTAYDQLVVPTSGRIFYQAAAGIGTTIHPRQRQQPLLITVGENDRTVTPYLARAAYNKQKHATARTDFKMFPGHSHFLIGEPGWEDVANFTRDWARSL